MFFGKYPALSPGIIAELRQDLRVLKAQRKSVEAGAETIEGQAKV